MDKTMIIYKFMYKYIHNLNQSTIEYKQIVFNYI